MFIYLYKTTIWSSQLSTANIYMINDQQTEQIKHTHTKKH